MKMKMIKRRLMLNNEDYWLLWKKEDKVRGLWQNSMEKNASKKTFNSASTVE